MFLLMYLVCLFSFVFSCLFLVQMYVLSWREIKNRPSVPLRPRWSQRFDSDRGPCTQYCVWFWLLALVRRVVKPVIWLRCMFALVNPGIWIAVINLTQCVIKWNPWKKLNRKNTNKMTHLQCTVAKISSGENSKLNLLLMIGILRISQVHH